MKNLLRRWLKGEVIVPEAQCDDEIGFPQGQKYLIGVIRVYLWLKTLYAITAAQTLDLGLWTLDIGRG